MEESGRIGQPCRGGGAGGPNPNPDHDRDHRPLFRPSQDAKGEGGMVGARSEKVIASRGSGG